MPSLVIGCNNNGISKTAPDRRPMLLLKDYLLDDMSSCSSNGFKSFPRRGPCCPPTVRLLVDTKKRQRSSNGARKGAIRRASEAVINAVKLFQPLTFSSSVKSSSPLSKLPRSFSRKLFKRGYFWRKTAAEKERDVRRWTYFHVEPDRTPKPEEAMSAVYSTMTSSRSSWEFSNSEGRGNDAVTEISTSKKFLDKEQFVDTIVEDSVYEEIRNDAAAEEEKSWSTGGEKVSVIEEGLKGMTIVGGVNAEEGSTKREWQNEDKEQFSPVSVLDCPFEDEEEITSPFTGSLVHFEGTKKKLMGKLKRFESLTKLEPVDLRKRFALADSESPRTTTNPISSEFMKEMGSEEKAEELLRLTEATVSSPIRTPISKVDHLLLDFFREEIERRGSSERMEYEEEVALVRDWLNGKPQEVILKWEVEEGRQVYLREMEKHWVWKSLEEDSKAEVALELESEAFNLLMEEVLSDFYC